MPDKKLSHAFWRVFIFSGQFSDAFLMPGDVELARNLSNTLRTVILSRCQRLMAMLGKSGGMTLARYSQALLALLRCLLATFLGGTSEWSEVKSLSCWPQPVRDVVHAGLWAWPAGADVRAVGSEVRGYVTHHCIA